MTENQGLSNPAHAKPLWPTVLAVWIVLVLLSALGVGLLQKYGMALLTRDIEQSADSLSLQAWGVLTKHPQGSPSRGEALEQARVLFQKAAEQRPGIGEYRLNAARMMSEQGLPQEALKEAEAALPFCRKDNITPLVFLYQVSSRIQDWTRTTTYARQAIALEPDEVRHFTALARGICQQSDPSECLTAWRDRLERFPADGRTYREAAVAALRVGGFEDASTWFYKASERRSLAGMDWLKAAVAKTAAGDLETAAQWVQRYRSETGRDPVGFLQAPGLETEVSSDLQDDLQRVLRMSAGGGSN